MRSIRKTTQLGSSSNPSKKYAFVRRAAWIGALLVLCVTLQALTDSRVTGASETSRASFAETRATGSSWAFSRFPLYFVENRGQLDPRVAFYIPGRDKTVYFASDGVTFALNSGLPQTQSKRWTVKLDFLGANTAVKPEGQLRTEAVFSYFRGGQTEWKAGVPSFSSVIYRELWPGIDLVYSGTVDRMKYSFVVRPGADPSQIRLAYRGATTVKVNASGELAVETPVGGFHDEAPVSFQSDGENQRRIRTAYQVKGTIEKGQFAYGFAVDKYDTSQELVIDPAVLLYCGFIGGAGDDSANAIALDGSGNAYVVGETTSTDATFPATIGSNFGGTIDAFVVKVNPAGTALIYSSYIGGTGSDIARGIAVDGAGNAYISGETLSNESSFPVLNGPRLTIGRNGDAFVTKVNPAGTALLYSGYIGGDGRDSASAIAIDPNGNAYIVGDTDSSEVTFPVTVGPALIKNADVDAFVAKINAIGTAFVYCGYIGGNGKDYAQGIAVNGAGDAFIVGDTASPQGTFPLIVGPDLSYNGGDRDAFVTKVNPFGTALVYSGYVGGTGSDIGHSIAIDTAGNAYLTGETGSDQVSFPVVGGLDPTFNGGLDAFVTKVNSTGTGLVYSGYIGGTGLDSGLSIAVDSTGSAYVAGETSSFQTSFPVIGGPQLRSNGVLDGFVAKLNPAGNALIYCGYLGGVKNDRVNAIAVNADGVAYVAGYTESDQNTFPVVVGPDVIFNSGATDAFVARIERRPDVTPPAIAPVGAVARSQGSTGVATLAFVSDEDTRPGNIFVGIRNIPPGISITDLTNNNGTVTAVITVPCASATGAFPIIVEGTDGTGLKSSADLTINVTSNTAPVLGTYPATEVKPVGASATVTPNAAPADNGVIDTMVATAPGFTGSLNVNKATGVISIQNAGPRELYNVRVTATDNCGALSSTTFLLSVGDPNPVPALTSVSPNLIAKGTPGATLIVKGERFVTDSKVLWNNQIRSTVFVNDRELRATITAQDLANLGTASVAVSSPTPGGGVSTSLSVTIGNLVVATNGASFIGSSIAREAIAAAFGVDLATTTQPAGTIPLPTNLAGTQVTIQDSTGAERFAPLFFVSPGQVNFQVPAGTALGTGVIKVRNGAGAQSVGPVEISLVAPGIFTANSTGTGVAAAQVLRVAANGVRTFEPVFRFDATLQRFVPLPIDFGPPSDSLFLILFGTGVRFVSSTNNVEIVIDGVKMDTLFAGAIERFVGLDQINTDLKRVLAGRGQVNVVFKADGQAANTFVVAFR